MSSSNLMTKQLQLPIHSLFGQILHYIICYKTFDYLIITSYILSFSDWILSVLHFFCGALSFLSVVREFSIGYSFLIPTHTDTTLV